MKNIHKYLQKTVKTKRKLILLTSTILLISAITTTIHIITKPKPNDDIYLLDSNSTTLYQNKNPNFIVDFGKRDNQDEQWVRFESKNSKNNPFDKSKKSLWQNIVNFFSPTRSYGIEMSLRGVNISDTDKLENNDENIKKVSEILGDSEVKTTTKLIELGREIGGSEDISKKTIVNGDVVTGVDLEYQIIKGKGLKEEIVIKSLDGYTQDCKDNISECKLPPNEFVFDMKLDKGLSLKKGWFTVGSRSYETYYFEDNRGNYVSHFLPSFAVDRAGNKTYDVILSVENEGDNKYKVKVSIDVQWLFSEDRVFPIRIDPSIVHSVKDDFDTGIYNGTQYVQSVGGVQLAGLDKPIVDGNTVGYWSFDSQAEGFTGSVTQGMVNGAYNFNGEDFVEVASVAGLNTGNNPLTIEGWIKPDMTTLTTRQWALVLGDGSTGNIHWTYNVDVGKVFAGIWSGRQCGVDVRPGEWTHIAFVYENSNVTCYANGVVIPHSGHSNSTVSLTSTKLTLAKKGVSSEQNFRGSFDELYISKVARSSNDIYTSYLYGKEKFSGEYISQVIDSGSTVSQLNISSLTSGESTGNGETPYSTTGLVAQWNLNETSGTLASSGGSCGSTCNGTLTNFSNTTGQDRVANSGWTYNNRRWGGGALMFDGVDDYVSVQDSSVGNFGTGDFSVEAWFKFKEGATNSYATILSKHVMTPVRKGYGLIVQNANNEYRGRVSFDTFDNGAYKGLVSNHYIVDGWNHVVATRNGNTLSIYVNGVFSNSVEYSGGIGDFSHTGLLELGRLGDTSSSTYGFNGIIDIVRLYNRALNASEVSSNYNSNAVVYAVRGGNSNNPNDGTWSGWKDNAVSTTLKSFDNKYLYNEKESGLVGYWSMDEENGNTVNDISGNGYDGIATGTTIVNGKFGKARSFNGTGDEIVVANSEALNLSNTDFTVSMYFKMQKLDGTHQSLLAKEMNADFEVLIIPEGKVCFVGAPGEIHFVCSSTIPKLNEWYHFVATRSGNTVNLYINGKLEGSKGGFVVGNTGNQLTLGARKVGYPLIFNGELDEVKIYSRALSLDVIQSEYLSGLDIKNTSARSSSSIYATEDNTLDDGLVSHWKMDEESGNTVSDSVGTNNGIATDSTIVNGRYGKARNFDGTSNSKITIPNSPNLDINGSGSQISIEFWLNSTDPNQTTANWYTVLHKNTGEADCSSTNCPDRQYAIYLHGTGDLHFVSTSADNTTNGVGTTGIYSPIGSISTNTWHHVVCVIDSVAGMMKMYIDGVEAASGPYSTAGIRQASGDVTIGNNLVSGTMFGAVDELKIYNIALTPDKISKKYHNELQNRSHRIGNTRNNDLIAYWKLDEQTGNQVNDSVGTNNGTATGSTIVNGKVGKARNFNGTSEYITFANSNLVSNTFTISTWFRTSGTHQIDPESTSGIAGTAGQKYLIFPNNTECAGVSVGTNGISVYEHADSYMPALAVYNGPVPSNVWNHLAIVYNNKQPSIYLNGVLVRTGLVSPRASVFAPSNVGGGPYGYFSGEADEVKIYNTALSSDKIFEEYASLKDTFEKRDTGLVAYWNMNESSGNNVKDSIGTSNGTATGATITTGVQGNARSFNGTNQQYLTVPNNSTININGAGSQITLSAWIKVPTLPTSNQPIVYKNSGGADGSQAGISDRQYALFLGGGTLQLRATSVNNVGVTQTSLNSPANVVQANTWTHIIAVIDSPNSVMKIYVNGKEVATTTFSNTGIRSATGPLCIGTNTNHTYVYNGLIDEVRIYNRALSATEIQNMYLSSIGVNSFSSLTYTNYPIQQTNISNKTSLPIYIAGERVGREIPVTIGESAYANYQPDQYTVGLWHLNELDGSNTYIKDSSGYGNDAFPVGSKYIPNGYLGGARSFKATEKDFLSIPDSPSLNPSAITLEAWVKPKNNTQAGNVIDKGGNAGYRMRVYDDGKIGIIDRGTTNLLISTNKIEDNKWSHIVATGDSTGLKIYINGVLDASNTTPYGGAITATPLHIGRYIYAEAEFFSGDIDEVRISNIARSADEIRQAYEVGLRTHKIEIEFGAELDSTNLISGNTDKSFTIDAMKKGLRNKGSNIHTGEKIIVKEKEYIAQGIVSSVNEDTGAIVVNSWDDVSTFPTGGFTTKANVFKWQKEYIPVKGTTIDTHLDQTKLLTLQIDSYSDDGSIWIDELGALENSTQPTPQTMELGGLYKYFQYKAILTSTDTNISPILKSITLDFENTGPTMEKVMRHGKYFDSGVKQPFWWAK